MMKQLMGPLPVLVQLLTLPRIFGANLTKKKKKTKEELYCSFISRRQKRLRKGIAMQAVRAHFVCVCVLSDIAAVLPVISSTRIWRVWDRA